MGVSKAAKGRAMPKGEIFGAIEASSGVKKKEVKAVFESLGTMIGAAEGDREIHDSGHHYDQAEEEGRDQGHYPAHVREDAEDLGEACADGGEVLHGEGAQGQLLSSLVSHVWRT